MSIIIKKHISAEGRIILAICDKGLLDKKFEENELQLDLTSNFYKGEEINKEEILKIIKESHVLNIVGTESVEFVLKKGFIKKENILRIKDVPYAQALVIRGE